MRKAKRIQSIKRGFVCISVLLIFISFFIPTTSAMKSTSWTAIAIMILAITLWFTKIIPIVITSLGVIVLFPLFKVLTFEESASTLGNEIIWLIIAMLIMGYAVQQTNLDKRIAIFIISLAKGNIKRIFLSFIMLSFLLTFMIPMAMGRLTVLLPIALGFIETFDTVSDKNLAKSIILIVTFTPYLSTLSVFTGAGGSIYSVSLFESMLGYEWGYLHWIVVMTPITIIFLFLFWLLLIWLFPTKTSYLEDVNIFLSNQKEKIGKITKTEKKLIALYLILIFLWSTKEIHSMSISMSSLLVTIFIFLPKINILRWEQAKRNIDWGVPLLFAAGLTIALSLQKSGVVDGMQLLLEDYSDNFSAFFLPTMLMLLFVLLRIFFTNFTAMIASLMPVVLSFAISTPFNPVWLGMLCVVAGSTSYLLPSQSIGNMTTFSTNYYNSSDLLMLGSLMTFLVMIVTLIAAFFYWPLVGISVYE